MNINKMEQVISSRLINGEIHNQSKDLFELVNKLYFAPRGEEIARNMYIAGVRSLQKIDVTEALAFAEKLGKTIFAVAVIRRMIGIYLSKEDLDRAKDLLQSLPDDEWKIGTQKKIESMLKLRASLLAEESVESKFFNILKQVERPPNVQDVKMACLLDRFSFDCFSHEIELIPVSKSNWKSVLSRPDINYFLAESIWSGHDGGWQFAMSSFDTAAGEQLKKLLSFCKEEGIQTIFWNKEDPTNFDSFIDVAKLFDYIFTTDSDCISKYVEECGHENVWPLPFAAQPIIHNPIRNTIPEHDIGFAGSWYSRDHGNRKRDTTLLLDASMNHGLHIFDRNFGTDSSNQFPSKYADFVKGSLTYKETCMAYRAYKIFLNVNSVHESPTMFSRRVFELLASYTNVVSTPSLGIEKMFAENVHMVSELDEAKPLIERLLADDFRRKTSVHRGYRLVHREHTYTDRVKFIFDKVGIPYEKIDSPLISCITCSNRPHMIENILNNFDCQNYSNKELVLMLEAEDQEFNRIEDSLADRNDVKIFRQSKEEFLGTAINRGIRLSAGEYIAKFDDDDKYGPNYLSDGLIPFSFSDASVVGKLETILFHEASGKYYLRFPGKSHRYLDLVMGATIIAKKSVFDTIEFGESNTGEDSEFLRRCKKHGFKIYASDPFNWVHMRHKSKDFHTWQVEDESLLKPAIEFSYDIDIDVDVNL